LAAASTARPSAVSGCFSRCNRWRWAGLSLLDRIAEREALLSKRAELLRKELADVEYELGRVTTAGQVVAQLLTEAVDQAASGADDAVAGGDAEPSAKPSAVAQRPGRAGRPVVAVLVPHRHQAGGEQELPDEYGRILQIVTEAGTPVQAKTVCQALEGATEPGRIETTRPG